MKFWEAMKSIQEGKKVKVSYWDEGQYLMIKDGSIINENERIVEISFVDDNWEIYDDRKEVENEKLKRICNEITKYISEDDCNEQNGELRMLKDYLYDFSCMIERVNKEYKLDK